MEITVRLFAVLRDQAGVKEFVLQLADGATVAEAAARLVRETPSLREHFSGVAYAVNQSYVPGSTVLHDGDELALIPPVSGG